MILLKLFSGPLNLVHRISEFGMTIVPFTRQLSSRAMKVLTSNVVTGACFQHFHGYFSISQNRTYCTFDTSQSCDHTIPFVHVSES